MEEDPLFAHAVASDPRLRPLAERMRPRTLDEVVGQPHLVGEDGVFRRVQPGSLPPSAVLWGPPGTGKTTLARLLAARADAAFEPLSATSAGVRELREAVARAKRRRREQRRPTILFVDEIHRFHRGQQDAILPHVEEGIVRLLGATTENPSFELNAALVSRVRVFVVHPLDADAVRTLLRRALSDRERGLGGRELTVTGEAMDAMVREAGGDGRRALSILELAADMAGRGGTITPNEVRRAAGVRTLRHDRAQDGHYDVASALIKSMRASDPDAAVYWCMRLLEAGDDPMFVARRLVIFAAEDVGNADPQALMVASAASQAAHLVGLPEAALPLVQATAYLALAPKSHATVAARDAAQALIRRHGALPVPLHLRNAPTALARKLGHGRGYVYPHDHPDGLPPAGSPSCLPDVLAGSRILRPSPRGWEARAARRLAELRRRGAGTAKGAGGRKDR